jgi:hypothetical protein
MNKKKKKNSVFLDSCTTRVPQDYHTCTCCNKYINKIDTTSVHTQKVLPYTTDTQYVLGTDTLSKIEYSRSFVLFH